MEEIENLGKRLRELREIRELTMDMVVYDINQKYNMMFFSFIFTVFIYLFCKTFNA